VANGPFARCEIGQVRQQEKAALLNHAPLSPTGRFPLLLKYLDAQETLSIQVHPDVEAAKKLPGAQPKTECWYVLDSRGGFIYKGLKAGVTPAQFRRALERDDVADLLERIDVQPGDFHFVPAGTVHALGAGVVVAEIQTPSDTTYRVSDWGRGREVHVEQAMQCIHFEVSPKEPPGRGGDCLLGTADFHVYLRPAAAGLAALPQGRCSAWMILAGSGQIRSDHAAGVVDFRPGDTLLLPADMTVGTATFFEPASRLEIHLPPF
jgi:mannose-6-phosphate isomerase